MSQSLLTSICRRCRTKIFKSQIQSFSSTRIKRADEPTTAAPSEPISNPVEADSSASSPRQKQRSADYVPPSDKLQELAAQAANEAKLRPRAGIGPEEPYHLNVYAHKQNTHITFTDPGRDAICSYSCGSIGLRHAQRKSFDANYQLAAYTFRKMAEKSWKIGGKNMKTETHMLTGEDVKTRKIEVVLRGYGVGREAFQKAILGSEGKMIRPLIKSVTDSTRLKFGGTRSPAVRRL